MQLEEKIVMKKKRTARWCCYVVTTFLIAGCIGRSGPTDEKAKYDANQTCEDVSGGLFTCETEIFTRNNISDDLVEITIGSAMVRTKKKVPDKLLAMAMMYGEKEKEALYRTKPGTKLDGQVKKIQTYVQENNTWKLDKSVQIQ
jgi:hypothetical protein